MKRKVIYYKVWKIIPFCHIHWWCKLVCIFLNNKYSPLSNNGPFFFFFNNVISFIQMLATINTPKVQAPFGVSLLHLVLIIQGYNQNYMKLLSFPIFWSWRVHEGYSRKVLYLISISLLTACRIIFNSGSSVWLTYFAVIEIWNMLIYTKHKK